ncbi:hypothetical protein MTsPCn9_31100 [Croceitalea sp. MTPC9]|uniref:hypothetical protein n=1 Tax=unclassified Croceitalea TaxID=2632280 RepID=UPI002B3C2A73|nr:hypothetical protein MTsPCn6_17520 [Croceitalea sp. MTPC6]GMN18170.1 hypothetical protein MTsPCn9_31100 [Croceitalea sp. MTPC9]
MKLKNFAILLLLFIISCKKDDPPRNPEGAILVFPLQNSECTTGISVNETLSQVTFEWQPSANTETYVLSVVNLNTNTPQTITVSSTSASLSIQKGAPFSWTVTSFNSNTDVTATSENWLFYNAGPQINYAPFPAQIITPVSGSTVQANEANQIVLRWMGADVEDDITSFEVYFSEQNPPNLLQTIDDAATMEVTVDVTSGNTYFWRVVTTDSNGNTSDSGIYDFKVL